MLLKNVTNFNILRNKYYHIPKLQIKRNKYIYVYIYLRVFCLEFENQSFPDISNAQILWIKWKIFL